MILPTRNSASPTETKSPISISRAAIARDSSQTSPCGGPLPIGVPLTKACSETITSPLRGYASVTAFAATRMLPVSENAIDVNDTTSAVERPLACPSVKTSLGRSPRPLTIRSAANMFADSKRSAFSKRSVKRAMPVMEVTAMISARNNKRNSPPFQSLRSSLREIRNRLLMGLLSTSFSAAPSSINLIPVRHHPKQLHQRRA